MSAPFVIDAGAKDAIDNSVARLHVLLEPGRAEGFAMFINEFPPLGGRPPGHHHEEFKQE